MTASSFNEFQALKVPEIIVFRVKGVIRIAQTDVVLSIVHARSDKVDEVGGYAEEALNREGETNSAISLHTEASDCFRLLT